jgi:hypothetical protein
MPRFQSPNGQQDQIVKNVVQHSKLLRKNMPKSQQQPRNKYIHNQLDLVNEKEEIENSPNNQNDEASFSRQSVSGNFQSKTMFQKQ